MFTILDRNPPDPATGSESQTLIRSRSISFEWARKSECTSITFANVSFSYPSRPSQMVLNNLNLKIPPGSTVALVGKSGGGKSTVINLIQRFYDPTKGAILIDDQNLEDMDMERHRLQIGSVTQDPVLFSGYVSCSYKNLNIFFSLNKNAYLSYSFLYRTILSNILYGLRDYDLDQIRDEVIEAAKSANAHDFIMSFPSGYATEVGERGVQLSGGQKQ